MKSLRRYYIPGATYFLTLVTYKRQPLLLVDAGLFWECWPEPKPLAWVILPDHVHLLLSNDDSLISEMIHRFKITYSRRFRNMHRPGRVWQNRFWDHIIRDEDDLRRHLDYIHYNSVKHGMVADPFTYAHSSLSTWRQAGQYERQWGVNKLMSFEGNFGE